MHLWLDDLRDPVDFGCPDYVWVKDPLDAIAILKSGVVRKISFDHDLGVFVNDREISGNDVAKAIEEMAFNGELEHFPVWAIHSANPNGRRNIEGSMTAAERFFNEGARHATGHSCSP